MQTFAHTSLWVWGSGSWLSIIQAWRRSTRSKHLAVGLASRRGLHVYGHACMCVSMFFFLASRRGLHVYGHACMCVSMFLATSKQRLQWHARHPGQRHLQFIYSHPSTSSFSTNKTICWVEREWERPSAWLRVHPGPLPLCTSELSVTCKNNSVLPAAPRFSTSYLSMPLQCQRPRGIRGRGADRRG